MLKQKRITDPSLIKEIGHSPCVICGIRGVDVHHLRSRKSGGPDLAWNLIPICRQHHSEIHNIGKVGMANKYDKFKEWLIKNGWKLEQKKWVYY